MMFRRNIGQRNFRIINMYTVKPLQYILFIWSQDEVLQMTSAKQLLQSRFRWIQPKCCPEIPAV